MKALLFSFYGVVLIISKVPQAALNTASPRPKQQRDRYPASLPCDLGPERAIQLRLF